MLPNLPTPMQAYFALLRKKEPLLRLLIAFVIGLGIALRLLLFFQNRNLIIDEANIVRNLAERGFAGLAQPLSYEQYAPPVFLWVEKLASILFGLGEKGLRLYPLLSGIGSLFLFLSLAKKWMHPEALWLPLSYLAGGFIFLDYSTEIKQYMPDVFVALLLLWLALRWEQSRMSPGSFLFRWMLAGSIAIWTSMPSVFILAGIGCYYAWPVLREKKFSRLLPLAMIASVWVAQFALYYFSILRSQIESSYLQNFHREYFIYLLPTTAAEWNHNLERMLDILGNVGGWMGVSVASNVVFLVVGGIYLLRRQTRLFMLLGIPIFLVLLAAALHQFSLIARVILFMLPLWLLVLGMGFDRLLRVRVRAAGLRWIAGSLLVIVASYDAIAQTCFRFIVQPYRFHQITAGMDWIQARGGRGSQLYVHDATVPTYIYYTELHPHKAKYSALLGAHRLKWSDDYGALTRSIRDTAYFLYPGGFPEEDLARRTHEIEQNMQEIGSFKRTTGSVFVYVPKSAVDAAGTTPN